MSELNRKLLPAIRVGMGKIFQLRLAAQQHQQRENYFEEMVGAVRFELTTF